jgi:O-antigen ligase
VSEVVAAGVVLVPALLLFAVAGRRTPLVAVCIVPLSFPIEQLELTGLPLRMIQLTTLAAVGLVATHRLASRLTLLPPSPLLFALGLFVVSALASTVVSVDPVAAMRLDGTYLLGLALAVTVVLACPHERSVLALISCTCAVAIIVCGAGLVSNSQLRPHYGAGLVENRATGLFGQPNELGAFAAIVTILAVGLFFALPRGDVRRLIAGCCVVVGLAALVVTLSRGSWLGLVFGLGIFVVLVPGARRRIGVFLVAVVLIVAAVATVRPSHPLLSIVVDRAKSLVDGGRNPYDHRPAIWQEALRQITARPLLGSGPGGYPVLAAASPSRVMWVAPEHAHGLLLTVAAEQGLLGLCGLTGAGFVAVFAVVAALRGRDQRWWRSPRNALGTRAGPELLAGPTAALGVVLGQGMLDYPLRNPVLATLVWLLLGLLAAVLAGSSPARRAASVRGTDTGRLAVRGTSTAVASRPRLVGIEEPG